MKVLMILTSHSDLGDTGHKTGFWLEEFTAPYYVFTDAGAEVTLASPKGGQPPIDPNSEADETESTERFEGDSEAKAELASTKKLSDMKVDDYDAVFFPGGHGPLWDLAEDPTCTSLIEEAVRQDKIIGAVCHAPAVFRHVKGSDGKPLVHDREVTGFTNTEEDAVQLSNIVPFLLEDMLVEKGAHYRCGDDWESYVVRDGKLITGQNPQSSAETAEAVLQLLR